MKIEGTNNNIILEKVNRPTGEAVTNKVQSAINTLVDVVSVSSKPKESNLKRTEETNKTISILNLANDATEKISDMFESIKGIVEQVANSNAEIVPKKVQVLQKEANDLLSGMKTLTDETDFDSIKPLTDEEAKIYVENKIGQTLDIIFPDDIKDGFGIEKIELSKKENIINTLATVKTAEARITLLKHTISKNFEEVKNETDKNLDVGNKLNNFEEAIKLTNTLQNEIVDEPQKALDANASNVANFTKYLV
ncbi:MAG: hypothetical protein SPJ04_01950 [Bdellovibrionota bacterium]|nr:hypothetical protein [Pseudomonadota bacterium]MDY6090000.1 hypothetical protein [Bdellovibrionota bacterium]